MIKIFIGLLLSVCLFFNKIHAQPVGNFRSFANNTALSPSPLAKMTIASRDNVNYFSLHFAPGKSNFKTDKAKIEADLRRKQPLPPNYYTTTLGFMCKKELEIEKATKIPFRFRLGSLQYCNMLEGK